uniref:Ribonuclease P protein subunit p30 n=1 Tax=Podarcis muralis TaxID=64176 RepID=A0A670HQZ1_PODMU
MLEGMDPFQLCYDFKLGPSHIPARCETGAEEKERGRKDYNSQHAAGRQGIRSCASPPRGFNMAEFVDLNIPHLAEKASLQKLVEAAAHLGYSTVAINYVVDYDEKKKEIVKPLSPKELFTVLPLVQGKSKPIKILSRLTLVVSDPSHCNILRSTSTNIKFYDIFAVFPKSGKLFHVACTTLDVDIVCINVTEKLPFYIKRPSVNVAIDRGIYFELIYVPAIKDSTMRRYTVSNALSLMQICRGKPTVPSRS